MKAAQKRLCIYPKDVQRITGRSERHSRELLKRIRTALGKPRSHFLTIEEFCRYTGLHPDDIQHLIID